MSSVEKQNLFRVLSDSWRIISSNALHFLTLSSLFIFPITLFNIIYTFNSPHPLTPTPTRTPPHSVSDYGHGQGQLISSSFPTSQILTLLLYSLPLCLVNICSILSITTSIFHAFHNRPLNLSSSLKSILPSFFPLLATQIAFLLIIGFLMGVWFFGLMMLGFSIDSSSTTFMAVIIVTVAVFAVLFPVLLVYLSVEWFLTDVVVAVESKWGFAAFRRSSTLVKGARRVVLLIIFLFGALEMMVWGLHFSFVSRSSVVGYCVVVEMVVYAAVSALMGVLSLAAKTVLFVYCKGELMQLPTTDKLGQAYIQLPLDVQEEDSAAV